MRAILLAALLCAACARAPEPAAPTPAAPPPTAEAPMPTPEAPLLAGAFIAVSTTAMGMTGDLEASADNLVFSKGARLETAYAGAALPNDSVIAGGDPFAAFTPGLGDIRIELRRILVERADAGAAYQPVCGGAPATFVALARDAAPTQVTALFFSGADMPGPEARDSRLCGAFLYMPD